jgi:hypothetical protein
MLPTQSLHGLKSVSSSNEVHNVQVGYTADDDGTEQADLRNRLDQTIDVVLINIPFAQRDGDVGDWDCGKSGGRARRVVVAVVSSIIVFSLGNKKAARQGG